MRAPLETGEHPGAIVFLDDAAAGDASEVRFVGLVGGEVVPFQNLHRPAVRARHIGVFLRAVEKIACDAATGLN